MPPKRTRTGTIYSFFKKIEMAMDMDKDRDNLFVFREDRDGDGHRQEQNNFPIVAEEQRSAQAPNPEEQRTTEEAPRQPAPKIHDG
jgi:hypothetical protein